MTHTRTEFTIEHRPKTARPDAGWSRTGSVIYSTLTIAQAAAKDYAPVADRQGDRLRIATREVTATPWTPVGEVCAHCPPIDDRCPCPPTMKHHSLGCRFYPVDHPVTS